MTVNKSGSNLNRAKITRACGLAQSIAEAAYWEDVNKDGLYKVANEIAGILNEIIEGE